MFLPEPMRYDWKVQKQTNRNGEYTQKRMLPQTHPSVKSFGCLGRLGDLCILEHLKSGEICNLECKWHGEYGLIEKDKNKILYKACSSLAKNLPVLKKPRWGKYPYF